MDIKWAKSRVFLKRFWKILWVCFAGRSKMKDLMIFYFPVQTSYLGKFWFTSYRSKCPPPMRVSKFFDHQCIWKESVDILDMHRYIHWGKVATETIIFGCVWPGLPNMRRFARVPFICLGGMTRLKIDHSQRLINF